MATKKASSKKSSKTTKKMVSKKEMSVKDIEKKIFSTESMVKMNPVLNANRIANVQFISAFIAEFIGTFILASIVLVSQGQPIAVLFGLSAIVLAFGSVSGAHVNPLITVGAWVTRKIESYKALAYIAAQALGALMSLMVFKSFLDQTVATLFSANGISESKLVLPTFLAELLGSFLFAFIVARVTSEKKESASIALGVGGGLFTSIVLFGSVATALGTSAIFNPAIAITLQAFTAKASAKEQNNIVTAILIYIGAALIGGILGFLLNELFIKAKASEKKA